MSIPQSLLKATRFCPSNVAGLIKAPVRAGRFASTISNRPPNAEQVGKRPGEESIIVRSSAPSTLPFSPSFESCVRNYASSGALVEQGEKPVVLEGSFQSGQ
jgi:hypothetical protein